MPPFLRRLLASLLLVATLPACATLTTGTTSTISVITDPPGASCTLTRRGDVVGVVNPTPGSVTVSKSMSAIDVTCARAGHGPGTGAIASQFQAMTVGNILIGGLIGIAVDAASGAAGTYPGSVTVVLPHGNGASGMPAALAAPPISPEDYAIRAAELRRSYDDRIAAARANCAATAMRDCESTMAILERDRDAGLRQLYQLGQAARTGT
jgi:hypothetical protein